MPDGVAFFDQGDAGRCAIDVRSSVTLSIGKLHLDLPLLQAKWVHIHDVNMASPPNGEL